MEPQRSIVLPITIAVLVSAVVFGSLGYLGARNYNSPSPYALSSATPSAISSVPTLTTTPPVPIPTSPSLTTTDWKTFSNSNYGYSLKYPTDWTVQQQGGTTTVSKDLGFDFGSYRVLIEQEQYSGSLDDYIANFKSENAKTVAAGGPDLKLTQQVSTTINGKTAIEFKDIMNPSATWDGYFVKNGNFVYQIYILKKEGEGVPYDASSYIATAEKILTTFTFLK